MENIYDKDADVQITTELVRHLVDEQFPQWKDEPVSPVEHTGHDNRTYHLGKELSVRLPSARRYVAAVEKESRILPYLKEHLSFPIPSPVAIGHPADDYPYPWSVNHWLEGHTLLEEDIEDKTSLASELHHALDELQKIDASSGPKAGVHNFYRGGNLRVYHQETVDALKTLKGELPVDILSRLWQESIESCRDALFDQPGLWVHGDIAPGNILVQNGHFAGLIDFGTTGVGDPSCDYAMAWTYFDEVSRPLFLKDLPPDMIRRARGWALWKALITYHDSVPLVQNNAHFTVDAILKEAGSSGNNRMCP